MYTFPWNETGKVKICVLDWRAYQNRAWQKKENVLILNRPRALLSNLRQTAELLKDVKLFTNDRKFEY